MDAAAERRQHADAPVAQLVAGSLNHDRPVVGNLAGCGFLIGEELQQVFGGTGVEIVFSDEARERGRLGQSTQFADQCSDAAAKLERTAGTIAFPEGHLARFARGGRQRARGRG